MRANSPAFASVFGLPRRKDIILSMPESDRMLLSRARNLGASLIGRVPTVPANKAAINLPASLPMSVWGGSKLEIPIPACNVSSTELPTPMTAMS